MLNIHVHVVIPCRRQLHALWGHSAFAPQCTTIASQSQRMLIRNSFVKRHGHILPLSVFAVVFVVSASFSSSAISSALADMASFHSLFSFLSCAIWNCCVSVSSLPPEMRWRWKVSCDNDGQEGDGNGTPTDTRNVSSSLNDNQSLADLTLMGLRKRSYIMHMKSNFGSQGLARRASCACIETGSYHSQISS